MRPSLRQQLGNFLRRRRGDRTLEQFALRTGISAATLCRLEAGTTNCSLDTLDQLRQVFNSSLQDIFPDDFAKPLPHTPVPTTGARQRPLWTPSQPAVVETPVA